MDQGYLEKLKVIDITAHPGLRGSPRLSKISSKGPGLMKRIFWLPRVRTNAWKTWIKSNMPFLKPTAAFQSYRERAAEGRVNSIVASRRDCTCLNDCLAPFHHSFKCYGMTTRRCGRYSHDMTGHGRVKSPKSPTKLFRH